MCYVCLWSGGENERREVGGVGRGKDGGRKTTFKDQSTPVGAIFSFPVTFWSLTERRLELTGAAGLGRSAITMGTLEEKWCFSVLLDGALSEGTLPFSQVHPGGPRPCPASSSRVLIGQGVLWNLNSVISQLQALSLQWLNSPDFSTGQISLLEYRDNSSPLLSAPHV